MLVDTLTQFFSATGPIALAIMGVVVSLNPPPREGRAHLIWASAFAIIGIITSAAIFRELRGTDESLDKIWGKVANIPAQKRPTGPRLEFAGIEKDDQGEIVSIQFHNTSDIDASGHFIVGGIIFTEDDKNAIETTLSNIKAQATRKILKSHAGMGLSRGMGLGFPIGTLPKDQIKLFESGKRRAYIIAIAIYIDENTPDDRVFVTETCAKITKLYTKFESCVGHNGYYYTDIDLLDVN